MTIEEIIATSTKQNGLSEKALQTVMENAVAVANSIVEAYELLEEKNGLKGEDVLNARDEGYAIAGEAAALHKRYLEWHKTQSAMVLKGTGERPDGQYAELLSGGR